MFNIFSRQCPNGTIPYTIKLGDNYYKLALQFNTTVQAISTVNPRVNPLSLRVSQQICIPVQGLPTCPEGNSYTIKPGDTLYAIHAFLTFPLMI